MWIRLVLGMLISFAVVLALMPYWIRWLQSRHYHQTVSSYSLKEYRQKNRTPIMGGVLFILVPVVLVLFLAPASFGDRDLLLVLLTFAGYGLIGYLDDRLIIRRHSNAGLSPKKKMALQVVFAVIFYVLFQMHHDGILHVPFTKIYWNMGILYGLLAVVMLAGSSNAVNLTDGMDGLSAGCTECALAAFLIIALVEGNVSIAIFCGCLMGALAAYLHFNVKPARIFMGDTGSLALGGVLAAIAMVLHTELAYIVIGGVFVIETVCVIIQQISVRTGHGRVFVYTPIHYAFLMRGMSDTQVVHRFWLWAAVFAAIGCWVGLH